MLKRICMSACFVVLLLSGCTDDQSKLNTKVSREFAPSQSSDVIQKSATEVVMKTGSREDITYHIQPGTIAGSDVDQSNFNVQTTKVANLLPFIVTESDLQNVKLGDDLLLMDQFYQGARGLLSYTGKQQDVLTEIRDGYAPALSIDDLNNMKKVVIPGNSNKYDDVVQAVQDYMNGHNQNIHNSENNQNDQNGQNNENNQNGQSEQNNQSNQTNSPIVTIPVSQSLDKNNPVFTRFINIKLKIDNGVLKGTYVGWVGPSYFTFTNVKYQETFPPGLDVQTTDTRFSKTGSSNLGETVTATMPNIMFQKNSNGDYEAVNQDFTLSVVATQASPPNAPYQLNNAKITFMKADNSTSTSNFPSLTITVKDGLQDVALPSLIERDIDKPSTPIALTFTPVNAANTLQLQYTVNQDQNIANVSVQNQNLLINPNSPGEMNVTLTVKDDFGSVVTKQAHVMLYQFVSDSSITLNEGETKTLPYTLTPSTITSMKWNIADSNVATLSDTHQITGNHAGSTLLTIDGVGSTGTIFSKQITVIVKSTTVLLQSMYFDPSSITMKIGDTLDLSSSLKFVPANATNKTIQSWTSSNPDIGTVDGNGVVTGKKAGTFTVTAQAANNVQAVATITIDDPNKGALNPSNPLYRW